MEQKRVLKVWQVVTLSILLAAIIASMFMPAVKIDGKHLKKVSKNMVNAFKDTANDLLSAFIDEDDVEDWLEDLVEEAFDEIDGEDVGDFDKSASDLEDKGFVFSYSPLRFMTNDVFHFSKNTSKMDQEDQEDFEDNLKDLEEDGGDAYKKLVNSYNLFRAVLIVFYVSAIVILILLICAYACNWTKFPILIVSTVYSVGSLSLFVVLRFKMMEIYTNNIMSVLEDADEMDYFGSAALNVIKKLLVKGLPGLFSVAFVVALIASALLLIMNIVSLVTGNRLEYVGGDSSSWDGFNNMDNQMTSAFGIGMGDMSNSPFDFGGASSMGANAFDPFGGSAGGDIADSIPVTDARVPEPVQIVEQKKPTVGKVVCTKGVAIGKGFQLPQDRKVIVGKSHQNANLVIDDPNVSNTHCSIRYNANNNMYTVIDHSTNGTFVNGVRMQKDVPMMFPAGTVISLADGKNQVTLG